MVGITGITVVVCSVEEAGGSRRHSVFTYMVSWGGRAVNYTLVLITSHLENHWDITETLVIATIIIRYARYIHVGTFTTTK